jgi:hypothetical protein
MTQQLVLPTDKALAMFPKTCPQHAACERTTRVGSITHLPGPIACETCNGSGDGRQSNDLQPLACADCDGLGYPPKLEIVTVYPYEMEGGVLRSTTVHGVVKLGPPIPVVDYADWEIHGDNLAGVIPFVMVNDHPDMDKPHVILVTQTIEDGGLGFDLGVTVKPGDVVYPITVVE